MFPDLPDPIHLFSAVSGTGVDVGFCVGTGSGVDIGVCVGFTVGVGVTVRIFGRGGPAISVAYTFENI